MRTLDGSKRMTYNKCIQDTQQKRDAEETAGSVSRESAAEVRADGVTRSFRLEAVGEEPDGAARYSGDELHCCM